MTTYNTTVTQCYSGASTIQLDTYDSEFHNHSVFSDNTARVGGFVAFIPNKSRAGQLKIENTTIIERNRATIAGGKYFRFEPISANLTSACTEPANGNSADAYGDVAAGTITKLELEFPQYIFPGQIFSISAQRKDFCDQVITESVFPVPKIGYDAKITTQGGSLQGICPFLVVAFFLCV